MPITLAQAKVGMANHVDQQVVDQFRRGSMLLEALTFDNSVSPGTGGSTLTYGYNQLKTPAGADFRDINTPIKFAWELIPQLEEKGVLDRSKLPFLQALYEILFEDKNAYDTIVKVMNKCTGFDYE